MSALNYTGVQSNMYKPTFQPTDFLNKIKLYGAGTLVKSL